MSGGASSGKANASSSTAKATARSTNNLPAAVTAPTRVSRRQQHAAPDFDIRKVNKESKVGKELASELVLNREAIKESRDREAKKQLSDTGKKPGWYTRVEPEDLNNANVYDEDVEEDGEQRNEPPQKPSESDNRRNKRKRDSHTGEGSSEPSRPSKVARTGRTTRNDEQEISPPADETAGNGEGDNPPPPDDDNDDEDPANAARLPQQAAPRNPDEKFLRDCIEQLQGQKPRKDSMRRLQIRVALAILRIARQPGEDRVQRFANIPAEEDSDRPDCYILDAAEAKRLLESDMEIDAPVFVPNGARGGLFADSMDRPIEQFLRTWLLDEEELVNVVKSAKPPNTKRLKTVAKLRRHFLEAEPERLHTWNMPDIHNPRPDHCTPHFVQSLNCNLLRDVTRRALDATAEEICPEICLEAYQDHLGCDVHKLTRKEYHRLMEGWEHWQGTAMLADSGAITLPHWDSWGFGTWISCHEGQIGVTWRSYPDYDEIEQYLLASPKAHTMGTSIYKVLRPGDAVYMPPGTIHTVFRRPSGNQTLAFAGHIIRRASMAHWLRVLNMESLDVEGNWQIMKGSNHEHLLYPMARAARAILGPIAQAGNFGGRDNWQLIENRLRSIDGTASRLRRRAFENPAVSREPSPETEQELVDESEENTTVPNQSAKASKPNPKGAKANPKNKARTETGKKSEKAKGKNKKK